jgi:hypothetical protein
MKRNRKGGGLRVVNQPQGHTETKSEKFIRIGSKRLAIAQNAIANLKQLSDREFYIYEERQWKRLILELLGSVEDVRQSFQTGGKIRHRNIFAPEPDLDAIRAELLRELEDDGIL